MSGQRIDVQGLRGIAVLLVVFFHAGLPVPGGFIGVDVFFVISGFVITGMLQRERDRDGRTRLGRFYARRVRRLLPALAVVLLFVAAGSLLFQSPLGFQQETSKTGVAAAVFVANAVLFLTTGGYFDAAATANPLLHTWTLAVEEQFYVVFPLLLLIGWRIGRRAVAWLVAGALVVSLAASIVLTYSSGLPFGELAQNRTFAFYGSPTRAWEFAAGALIAICEPSIRRRLSPMGGQIAGVTAVALLVISALVLHETSPFPGFLAAGPVVAAALFIAAGIATKGTATRWLESRPLVWVGDLSYSWYLWHWPMIVYFTAVFPQAPIVAVTAVAALSLLPAWASFRYVEQRFRKDRSIIGRRAVLLAVACMLIPALAMTTLFATTRLSPGPVALLKVDEQPHLDDTASCQGNLPGTAQTEGCTWKAPSGKGTIVLLGDSNAGHFAEPLKIAAAKTGYDFVLATYGGCPLGDLEVHYATPYNTSGCREFQRSWEREIITKRPEAVVLASASGSYLSSEQVTLSADGDESTTGIASKARVYEEGLRREISSWSRVGVPTLLVHQVPKFVGFDLRACPAVRIFTDVSTCGMTTSRSAAEKELRPSSAAESAAAKSVRRVRVLGMLNHVCRDTCSTERGGRFVYRDGAHLSVPFSETLEPVFARELNALVRGGGRPMLRGSRLTWSG